MSKEETKKVNDPIGKYLVQRLEKLERDNALLIETNRELLEQLSKLKEIKKLFVLECGMICLYDIGGHFQNAITIDTNDFGKYLVKTLELKEKK